MPIDWTVALTHVDSDRRLLAELAGMFSEDCPRLLLEARESIAQADCEKLERVAHTLKGRLAFFGVHDVRDGAMQLETMGRLCDLKDAPETLAGIEADIARIIPEFDELSREQEL
jgi:two-component system, sensor histidine kinase and response regulator